MPGLSRHKWSRAVKRIALGLAIVLFVATTFADESTSPHRMVGEDGRPDTQKCTVCHNEDMSLTSPAAELCTLCHSRNQHSGALRHLEAQPSAVAHLLPSESESKVRLPLAEDGRLFCGTCHLFHDPAVSGEAPLASPWLPVTTGLAGAVRRRLEARVEEAAGMERAATASGTFSIKGTTMVRLPVHDGTLCRHCHGKGR